MIAQTFQALMMAQTAGSSEGTGVASIIFDFETFTPTEVENVQTASNLGVLWSSGQVYPSVVRSEYGTRSLLFITQVAEFISGPYSEAYTDFTVEFSYYMTTGSPGFLMYLNRGGSSSGEVDIQITETFTGSGVWNLQFSIDDFVTPIFAVDVASMFDQWVKVAYVVNKTSNTVSLYLNGTRVGLTTAGDYSGTPYDLTGFQFGRGGFLFTNDFYLDNFRFSEGARYINPTYTVPTGPFTPD